MIVINKLMLYGEIVFISFVALLLHFLIMGQVCSNCGFLTIGICFLGWLPAVVIGFVLFLFILKTKFGKYITIKSTSIFCFILAVIIIMHAIFFYYITVPPKDVTNQWHCNENQEIFNVLKSMGFGYDTTYGDRGGYLNLKVNETQGTDFDWTYDEGKHTIIMTELDGDWKLILRLDINLIKGSHYTLTTYYVDNRNFTLFDPLFFHNAHWKGSLL